MIYADNGPETLRVYFLRHGETDWNRWGLYQGHGDIPLNERGRRQAIKVAVKLCGETFDNVYVSDLVRAGETAQIILSRLKAKSVTSLRGLRELDFGHWEGLSFTEVEAAYPQEVKDAFAQPDAFRPPGGESVVELRARVVKAWEGIIQENRAGTIMIVTHGGPIRVLWGYWLGKRGMALWNIAFPHCALGFASFNTAGRFPQTFITGI
ncbi:MAG: histidine phosphatase family protein [Firmicutes bacterium]|mgnify:CR=1 FL=1|nr:histidine phosphatase family protein [Bacillota bacterium]